MKLDIACTDAQLDFLEARDSYVDFEGAIRTGKSTFLCRKVRDYCLQHPGMCCALTRWSQDGLDAQLKPMWRSVLAEAEVGFQWESAGEYDQLPGNSRCYLRSLKAAEETSRYGKLAGLTLAVLGIDQAEEVPEDVYRAYVPARLSQVGYPHQVLLTPNPPAYDHWLCKDFPETGGAANHRYIRAALHDMTPILGGEYVEEQERGYPRGSPLYRRFIEGRRGLSVVGDPVYGSVFAREVHVAVVVGNPDLPVIEAWDFGHKHPAVLWSQFTLEGGWHVLAELMGTDQFIEDFAPAVLEARQRVVGPAREWNVCCDPAGAAKSSHGLSNTALTVLADHGIYPQFIEGSNTPSLRDAAIQRISAHLMKMRAGKPFVQVHPDCTVFIDGCEAGYVWDVAHRFTTTVTPNVRRPKKDGFYDHLQNCAEYTWLNFGPVAMSAAQVERTLARDQARAVRRAARDWDEYDALKRQAPSQRAGGRGGY